MIPLKSRLYSLLNHGQSVWLDSFSRSLLVSGELARLIAEEGLRGLASDPLIFERVIKGSSNSIDLQDDPEAQGLEIQALYERRSVRDVQAAADLFLPIFLKTKRRDGHVSHAVSPLLAHTTPGMIDEARRLWQTVARENLMIAVPGTSEGIVAFRQLISEGISVNVTLLYAPGRYEQVAAAYIDGLEHLVRQGGHPGKVSSVASFFLNPIDTAVDGWISKRLKPSSHPEDQAELRALLGKVAIASAKALYQRFLAIFHGHRWQELSARGAYSQRLLWAGTGVKHPNYYDVGYVEELIGPDTIVAASAATIAAFRDHGRVWFSLAEKVEKAARLLQSVERAGLPLKELTDKLLAESLQKSADTFAQVLRAMDPSVEATEAEPMDLLELKLMKELEEGRR